MKHDMSGAAAVVGALRACALLRVPQHVVGVIAAAENMPSGTAYRPGDIVTTMSGKTVEVLNTDAEGRVVLADALHYARTQFQPKSMIDLATLTGACVVALGKWASGLFGNDEKLIERVRRAGETTGERVWPMPLWDAHKKHVAQQDRDREEHRRARRRLFTAAAFLAAFVGDTPWVHLDIAGTALGHPGRAAISRSAPPASACGCCSICCRKPGDSLRAAPDCATVAGAAASRPPVTTRDPATPKPRDPASVPGAAAGARAGPAARPPQAPTISSRAMRSRSYMAQLRQHAPISREQEHALAVRWVEQRRPRRRAPARAREPAAGGEDRDGVPAGLDQRARSDPGGQRRAAPGDAALRPLQGREALLLRRLLDPRLHPQVHPRQHPPGAARQDPRRAQALLPPEQGEAPARAAGLRGGAEAARRASRRERVRRTDMEQRLSRNELSLQAPAWSGDDGREVGDYAVGRGASAEQSVGDAELRRGLHGARARVRAVARAARPPDRGCAHPRRGAALAAGARHGVRRLARARAPARGAHRGAARAST